MSSKIHREPQLSLTFEYLEDSVDEQFKQSAFDESADVENIGLYHWKYFTSNFIWHKIFDISAQKPNVENQNYESLFIACKWEVRFSMYVFGGKIKHRIPKVKFDVWYFQW